MPSHTPWPNRPCPRCGRVLPPSSEMQYLGMWFPVHCCPDCNNRTIFYVGKPIDFPLTAPITHEGRFVDLTQSDGLIHIESPAPGKADGDG